MMVSFFWWWAKAIVKTVSFAETFQRTSLQQATSLSTKYDGQLVSLLQAYADQLQIKQNNLKVMSTNRSRTYQSLVAATFGLLGENIDFSSLDIELSNSTEFCRSKVGCYLELL